MGNISVRAGALVVIFGSGCLIKPDDVAQPAKSCVGVPFANLQPLDAVFQQSTDPYERADQKEMYFATYAAADMHPHVFRATRSDSTAAYSQPTMMEPFNQPGFNEGDMTMTGDNLRLMFLSYRNGDSPFAYEVTRANDSVAFSSVSGVPGVDNIAMDGIDLEPDGLGLYFTRSFSGAGGDGNLYHATRPSLTAPFTIESTPVGDQMTFASVTPDRLEVFYNKPGNVQLYARSRSTVTGPFDGQERMILQHGGDPDVSPDGQRLVVATANGFSVMTRSCP